MNKFFTSLGYRVTSNYGYRTHPVTKQKHSFHDGIDLVRHHLYPIPAFVGGTVLYAGDGRSGTGVGGYGNVVVIRDKNGVAHVYAHLHDVAVRVGQAIQSGAVIGRQGNTGKYTTGSHLHYEVRKKSSPSLGWVTDAEKRTYDPTTYLTEFFKKEGELTVSQYNELKKDISDVKKLVNALQIAVKDLDKNKLSKPSNSQKGNDPKEVEKAIKNGITVDGRDPHHYATREHVFTMLNRTIKEIEDKLK